MKIFTDVKRKLQALVITRFLVTTWETNGKVVVFKLESLKNLNFENIANVVNWEDFTLSRDNCPEGKCRTRALTLSTSEIVFLYSSDSYLLI